METTYAHLSDDDHRDKAEVAAGIKDPTESENRFTPHSCRKCNEPLPPNARVCHLCNNPVTVKGAERQGKVESDSLDYALNAQTEEDKIAAKRLAEFMKKNPEIVADAAEQAYEE